MHGFWNNKILREKLSFSSPSAAALEEEEGAQRLLLLGFKLLAQS